MAQSKSKANWPVYTMPYRCMGQSKNLRVEWHHKPKTNEDVREVIQCLKDYTNNPQDMLLSQDGRTFKTLLPDYCIVMASGHKTDTSLTDRPPDTNYHISVRFGRLSDRSTGSGVGSGYSVHIYLNENTKKYNPAEKVVWGSSTPDKDGQWDVYRGRTQWPPNASATTAPPAPGVQSSASAQPAHGTTKHEAAPTGAWGRGGNPFSTQPSAPQSGQQPGHNPFTGPPPLGHGSGRGQNPSSGPPPSGRGSGRGQVPAPPSSGGNGRGQVPSSRPPPSGRDSGQGQNPSSGQSPWGRARGRGG